MSSSVTSIASGGNEDGGDDEQAAAAVAKLMKDVIGDDNSNSNKCVANITTTTAAAATTTTSTLDSRQPTKKLRTRAPARLSSKYPPRYEMPKDYRGMYLHKSDDDPTNGDSKKTMSLYYMEQVKDRYIEYDCHCDPNIYREFLVILRKQKNPKVTNTDTTKELTVFFDRINESQYFHPDLRDRLIYFFPDTILSETTNELENMVGANKLLRTIEYRMVVVDHNLEVYKDFLEIVRTYETFYDHFRSNEDILQELKEFLIIHQYQGLLSSLPMFLYTVQLEAQQQLDSITATETTQRRSVWIIDHEDLIKNRCADSNPDLYKKFLKIVYNTSFIAISRRRVFLQNVLAELYDLFADDHPDIVQVQNLLPLFFPVTIQSLDINVELDMIKEDRRSRNTAQQQKLVGKASATTATTMLDDATVTATAAATVAATNTVTDQIAVHRSSSLFKSARRSNKSVLREVSVATSTTTRPVGADSMTTASSSSLSSLLPPRIQKASRVSVSSSSLKNQYQQGTQTMSGTGSILSRFQQRINKKRKMSDGFTFHSRRFANKNDKKKQRTSSGDNTHDETITSSSGKPTSSEVEKTTTSSELSSPPRSSSKTNDGPLVIDLLSSDEEDNDNDNDGDDDDDDDDSVKALLPVMVDHTTNSDSGKSNNGNAITTNGITTAATPLVGSKDGSASGEIVFMPSTLSSLTIATKVHSNSMKNKITKKKDPPLSPATLETKSTKNTVADNNVSIKYADDDVKIQHRPSQSKFSVGKIRASPVRKSTAVGTMSRSDAKSSSMEEENENSGEKTDTKLDSSTEKQTEKSAHWWSSIRMYEKGRENDKVDGGTKYKTKDSNQVKEKEELKSLPSLLANSRSSDDKNSSETKKKSPPRSAYFLFFDHIRPRVEKENPEATTLSDIVPMITAKYNALGDTERKRWEEKSTRQKEQYQKLTTKKMMVMDNEKIMPTKPSETSMEEKEGASTFPAQRMEKSYNLSITEKFGSKIQEMNDAHLAEVLGYTIMNKGSNTTIERNYENRDRVPNERQNGGPKIPSTKKIDTTPYSPKDSTQLKMTLKHIVVDGIVYPRKNEEEECQPTATYHPVTHTIVLNYSPISTSLTTIEADMNNVEEIGCWTVYANSKTQDGIVFNEKSYFENGFMFFRADVNIKYSINKEYTTKKKSCDLLLEFEDKQNLIELLESFSIDEFPVQYTPLEIEAAIYGEWKKPWAVTYKNIENMSRSITALLPNPFREECVIGINKRKLRVAVDDLATMGDHSPKKLKNASFETLQPGVKIEMSVPANNTRDLILLNASTSTGSCIIMPTHNATKSKISCRTQDIDCSKEMIDTQVVNKEVNDVPLNESLHSGILAGGSMSSSISRREREIKKQKEEFLMFTRVLIKYLEQKDKRLHRQAKVIIKDCAERNKRQEPGYESVTESMKRRLKELVGDYYWKKTNEYLIHFIEQKRRQHAVSEPEETEKKNDDSGRKTLTMTTSKRKKEKTAVANESINEISSTKNEEQLRTRECDRGFTEDNLPCDNDQAVSAGSHNEENNKNENMYAPLAPEEADETQLVEFFSGCSTNEFLQHQHQQQQQKQRNRQTNVWEPPPMYIEQQQHKTTIREVMVGQQDDDASSCSSLSSSSSSSNGTKNNVFLLALPMMSFLGIFFHVGLFTYVPVANIAKQFITSFLRFTATGFFFLPFEKLGVTYPFRVILYAAILVLAASYEVSARTKYAFDGQHVCIMGSLIYVVGWVLLLYFRGIVKLRHALPLPIVGMLFSSSIDSIASSLDIITTTLVENQMEIKTRLSSSASNKYQVGNELFIYAIHETSMPYLNLLCDVLILGMLGLLGRYFSIVGSSCATENVRCQMLSIFLITLCTLATILLNYTLLMESSFFSDEKVFDSDFFYKNKARSLIELVKSLVAKKE